MQVLRENKRRKWSLSWNDRVGVIKTDGKGSKAALVYGQMNEPPGARARVALTGLTVAEYFRDKEGQDVLFFVDNILDLLRQDQRFRLY